MTRMTLITHQTPPTKLLKVGSIPMPFMNDAGAPTIAMIYFKPKVSRKNPLIVFHKSVNTVPVVASTLADD